MISKLVGALVCSINLGSETLHLACALGKALPIPFSDNCQDDFIAVAGLMQTRWMYWCGLSLSLFHDSHSGTRSLDLHMTKFAAKSNRSTSGLRESPAPRSSGFRQDMSRCFFPRKKASDKTSHLQGIISEKEKARQGCSS